MTVPGLTLPRLSEADPDTHGEGSINQLGLATIADRLADEMASREVTARMTRIRWVTAIAVGATVCEALRDQPAADGITPPYLVYEWLVVEAIARREGELDAAALQMVPGIDKARAVLSRSWSHHLDATQYLKTPKVFGFTGVFRTLAEGLDVIDADGLLTPRGEELVRAWEEAEALDGFLDRSPGTHGAKFVRRLERTVGESLAAGRVMLGAQSHLWTPLAQALRPDNAERRERELLWNWLTDPHDPDAEMRRQSLHQLLTVEWTGSEREALARILVAERLSQDLRVRIGAIEAYEQFASLLHRGFDRIRWRSTSQGTAALTPGQLGRDEELSRLAAQLPSSWEGARTQLEAVDLHDHFALAFASFAERMTAQELADALLAHHERVQAGKPPAGKRPWFSRYQDGVVVRPGYSLRDIPEPPSEYIHPYRITALRRFIDDLRPWELRG